MFDSGRARGLLHCCASHRARGAWRPLPNCPFRDANTQALVPASDNRHERARSLEGGQSGAQFRGTEDAPAPLQKRYDYDTTTTTRLLLLVLLVLVLLVLLVLLLVGQLVQLYYYTTILLLLLLLHYYYYTTTTTTIL